MDNKLKAAKALYNEYVDKCAKWDKSTLDMIFDDALIQDTRHYPTGSSRTNIMPAPMFKKLVKWTLWVARLRKDRDTYLDPSFTMEGDDVRIHATRFNHRKKYHTPVSFLVGANGQNVLGFKEFITETRPFVLEPEEMGQD